MAEWVIRLPMVWDGVNVMGHVAFLPAFELHLLTHMNAIYFLCMWNPNHKLYFQFLVCYETHRLVVGSSLSLSALSTTLPFRFLLLLLQEQSRRYNYEGLFFILMRRKALVYIGHIFKWYLICLTLDNRYVKLNYIYLGYFSKKCSVLFVKCWNYRASFIKESAEIVWVIKGILTTLN